jgi:deoxyribonucleoside regulator
MAFKYKRGDERADLLADVSEMYYEDNLTQAEIARSIGLTRSAVSRILAEARQKGIVEIRVRRPIRFDEELSAALAGHFGLKSAHVFIGRQKQDYDQLRFQLGEAAARMLETYLQADSSFGIAWGTTVSATIDALEELDLAASRVVQLVGVLGSDSHAFNAQALVERMARKVGGKSFFLYSPFIVQDAETAHALLSNDEVRQTIEAGRHCDVALLGIGSTDPDYCSLYQGRHISLEELEVMRAAGAVGDVCAQYFDVHGTTCDLDFHKRLIGVTVNDLMNIPIRLGVAGGEAKAQAIAGALLGGQVNVLITDHYTATLVLGLHN